MSLRYKILIAALFFSAYCLGQGKPINVQRGLPSVTANDARLKAGLNLGIPVVADTSNALNGGLDSLGLVVQIRTTGDWYKRDTFPGGHKWTKVSANGIDSSLAATKYGVDTAKQALRNSINTKKDKSDSLLQTGYVTHSQDDTAKQALRTSIAGKQPTGAYVTAGTGDVAFAGPGSVPATIQSHAVTNPKAATMPSKTVKANITGSTADQADVPIDTLASRITPDSFRIYRKPGSDSVFVCVTPVSTGIEKCVFQYHDSVGTGGGGAVSDSGFSIGYANLNGIPLQKVISGSTRFINWDTSANNPGAITDKASRKKLADSLGGIIDSGRVNRIAALALKRDIADTTNQTGVPLMGRMYKSAIDSMKAVYDLRYKLGSDSTAVTGYRTGFALDDSIYQKDPYTWQWSIVSPLSDSTTVGYRQDAPSIVRCLNGDILILWAVFPTTDVSDNGPCRIYGAISHDNGRTWVSKGVRINNTLSTHISTPSLFVQPNGNIICIANFKAFYAAVPTFVHTGANFYRYKSTDNGVTFTLMDSLFTSVTAYNYTSAGRIAQSIRTKRLFLPFGKQTTVIGHYLGGYFYSDDFGETWTQSGNTITPTDTLVNEPGIFIAQNNAPNDTSSGVERIYYYWTNTISPVPIKSVQSTDNGATVGAITNLGFPTFASVAAFSGINSETEVVGLVNRFFVSNTTGQGITRKYMDIVSSIDGGRSFRRLTNLVGWDSGYHYFEPAWVYDSVYGNMLAAMSRMNDPQSRSDIRFYRVPARTITNSYNYDPPQFTIGADLRQMSTSPASILQIYSRDRDNKFSVVPTAYLNFGSASGTAGTFWPWINSAASTDFNGGLFISPKIGNDGNAAYYSGAVAINATTAAGGTIVTQPLFRVNNNSSTKFSVGPDGKLAIGSDSRVAWLALPAGSATAGTAPIQFTAGPPTTTPVSGQLQSNTGLLIFDSSATVRDTLETRSHVRGLIAGLVGGGNPFSDATALVKNSSDATKLAIFSAAGITTATTRTYNLPDFNGNFAMTNHGQTWTGAQDMTGATVTVADQTANNNSSNSANTRYVDAALATAARGNVTTIADADYTVASNVESVVYYPAITASRTVTLPSAASFTNRHIRIWFAGGNGGGGWQLTLSSSSNIVYLGSGSTTLPTNITNALVDFQSDGTSWIVTGFTH